MSGGHSSSGIGSAISKGVGMFHGTGEAIRGNFNAAVDQAGGDRLGVEKNSAIASKGAQEIDEGYHHKDHSAGASLTDTERERMNTHTAATNYGSHSTNTGNKLDPRFDSDLDHRGTATGSTNTGHHSSNVANKLDPRIDSDIDHRANPNSSCPPKFMVQNDGTNSTPPQFGSKSKPPTTANHDHEHEEYCNCHAQHIHRGSITGGTILEAANKLDPILESGKGSTIANKNHINDGSNTRVDAGHYRCVVDKSKAGRTDTLTFHTTEPSFNASHGERQDVQEAGSDRDSCQTSDTNVQPDVSQTTGRQHKSTFLELLDPKASCEGSKQTRSSGA